VSGWNYSIARIQDTRTTLAEGLKSTQPQTKTTKTSQQTLPTFRSEIHWQLLIRAAQEAHTIPEASNSGHPPVQMNPQTHLVTTLCLLRPSQRRKLLQGLSQEEEEMENHPQDPATKPKTPKELGTSLISHSDELLTPLAALEGLTTLENQEDPQMYPPLTLFPSNLPMT